MIPKVFIWLHDTNTDEVAAWQLNGEEEPEIVVAYEKRGFRDPKQAVREELADKGLIPAPTRGASGGKHYNETGYRLYQL